MFLKGGGGGGLAKGLGGVSKKGVPGVGGVMLMFVGRFKEMGSGGVEHF